MKYNLEGAIINKNYNENAFKDMLVWKNHSDIHQEFEKYPSIYLNFRSARANNYDTFKKSF